MPTDLRLALTEAGEGAAADSCSDQLLLLCYHYDPQTGRYWLAIIWTLLASRGGVTVAADSRCIGLALLREARGASGA